MYASTPALVDKVAAFTGGTLSTDAATEHVEAATSYVKAYVRDVGFLIDGWPNDELASVIVAVAARSLANPTGVWQTTTGPFSVSYSRTEGFTLAERAVLDRYRVRAL